MHIGISEHEYTWETDLTRTKGVDWKMVQRLRGTRLGQELDNQSKEFKFNGIENIAMKLWKHEEM